MTIAKLRYGERETDYQITPAERLTAKILIHVHPGGMVEVEAPPDRTTTVIKAAVQKRARWIFENLDAANDARTYALPREYVGGETHFYLAVAIACWCGKIEPRPRRSSWCAVA